MVSSLEKLYKELNIFDKEEFSYFNSECETFKDGIALRYRNAFLELKPNAVFCLENEPFILFFDLTNEKNVDEKIKIIHQKTWNFDKAPVVVISKSSEIIFYNAFDFDNKTFALSKLTDNKSDYLNFSYENIYSGELFNKYPNAFNDNNRLNKRLLYHITSYREELANIEKIESSVANNLLARVIFLRYLQDREISISKSDGFKFIDAFASKTKLYDLFNYLKSKFNGDLFDISENESDLVSDNQISLLKDFFEDTSVTGQLRFLPLDFSIIPIELVSNIYENFLNTQRVENKAYYTPTFLVDYMISKTVAPFLKGENKNDSNCKVLDPACGSGIFLIEALRKIIQKEESLNHEKLTTEKLKELVEKNIFGIDKDVDAINIAIFSLYITLLDYQDPRSMLNFKFPKLKNKNFYTSDFFSDDNEFNKKIKSIAPNFILSNPPYGNIKTGNHLIWCNKSGIPNSGNQIAQSFLARIKDFTIPETQVAMLVTSKILYNINAENFRKYFLKNFKINEVFELSAVRKQIFNEATPPVSIIFYEYSENDNLKNTFKHISIKPSLFFKYFKTLLIEKNDEKVVEQSYVYCYDWLWKVLLYGNILDFYFIKRLKDNFYNIEEQENVYCGQGITQNSGNYDSTHLIGYPFLDTKKKELQKFFIASDNAIFNKKNVHRVRNRELFKAPATLVKRGLNPNLSCVSAFSNRNIVFTDSVFSIKSEVNDINLLKNIAGILNSDFINYLTLQLTVSAGVERDEIKETEFMSFPYSPDVDLNSIVDSLQVKMESDKLSQLNSLVNKAYSIDESETDLIDYALNISIPVWKFGDTLNRFNKPIAFNKVTQEQLNKYIEIFCENFAEQYRYFNVDTYLFKNCTLINFKARETNQNAPVVTFIKDKEMEEVIKSITPLSLKKITNEIFIKKDIKGFQENSFYVLKTNEYKNWHRAIARLDVNEFSNAIWEAELGLSK